MINFHAHMSNFVIILTIIKIMTIIENINLYLDSFSILVQEIYFIKEVFERITLIGNSYRQHRYFSLKMISQKLNRNLTYCRRSKL